MTQKNIVIISDGKTDITDDLKDIIKSKHYVLYNKNSTITDYILNPDMSLTASKEFLFKLARDHKYSHIVFITPIPMLMYMISSLFYGDSNGYLSTHIGELSIVDHNKVLKFHNMESMLEDEYYNRYIKN